MNEPVLRNNDTEIRMSKNTRVILFFVSVYFCLWIPSALSNFLDPFFWSEGLGIYIELLLTGVVCVGLSTLIMGNTLSVAGIIILLLVWRNKLDQKTSTILIILGFVSSGVVLLLMQFAWAHFQNFLLIPVSVLLLAIGLYNQKEVQSKEMW